MSKSLSFKIRFDDLDARAAGQAAESLRRALLEDGVDVVVKRVRDDPEALDMGAVLGLVLAAPAIVELARGVSRWLDRSHTSKVTITGPDGTIVAENITAKQAGDLADRMLAAKRP